MSGHSQPTPPPATDLAPDAAPQELETPARPAAPAGAAIQGRAPAAGARGRRSWIPRLLFSMKFAIWIAVALAVTSVAGVLLQQFFPMRNARDEEMLAERLPGLLHRVFVALQLYDPFRAVWFRALLATLSVSLTLCSWKRFRSALRQAFSLHVMREPRQLQSLKDSATVYQASPEIFETAVARLRSRLYRGAVERVETQLAAALHYGGVSRLGPVVLHLGILVLVIGGLVSSLAGRKHFIAVAPGQTVSIPGSGLSLRLDDFTIERYPSGRPKLFLSKVGLLEGGREVARRDVAVNHPLVYAGHRVYQSSFGPALVFAVAKPAAPGTSPHQAAPPHTNAESPAGAAADPAAAGDPRAAADPAAIGAEIRTTTEGTYSVPGHPGYEFRVARFYSHLLITDQGPRNAGDDYGNPAARVEVLRDGQPVGEQWAFANYPAMTRSQLPFTLELCDVEPERASIFDVNTDPGAPLIWLGFALSTLGLVLAFLVQHRCFFLLARPSERGWTLWVAGRSDRDRIAFTAEFDRLMASVRDEVRRLRGGSRGTPPPAGENSSGEALVAPNV